MKAIDLFAGLGGFTEAASMNNINVVWAANHWEIAVEYHRKNHPEVAHSCQDLQQADWHKVPAHDLLLASPACQGHSIARGKERAHHDATRSTAWAVVSCAEVHQPKLIVVENVTTFIHWRLFPAWKIAMKSLGYAVSPHIVDCADLGVPQSRERVFIVCTRSAQPIKLQLPKLQHKAVDSLIEWDQHRWKPINKPRRSRATLARVARGREAFGSRFVMPYYGSGSGMTGRCLSRPIGTITTRDRWAVVNGDAMRMLQPSECRKAMTFRDDYQLPANKRAAVHLLGNAVPPLAASVLIQAVLTQA